VSVLKTCNPVARKIIYGMNSEGGDSEGPVDGERSQTLLPEPDFLPAPVFPKENYLESVGGISFSQDPC
jgi:hypothetical protein